MKKLLALLLAVMMVIGLFAACAPAGNTDTTGAADDTTAAAGGEDTTAAASGDVEVVTYFCTIGAYLDVLQAEVEKWNAGEGAEKGVKIEITSNINDGSSAIETQMQAGNFWDLMDGGSTASWVAQGWVKDLETVENDDIKALLESYRDYMVPGLSYVNGITTAVPLEVVPIKMVVNKDLFDKNNLDYPKTWDDVVECAKVITENGGGEEFGFGGSNWSAMYRRLLMKATMSSTEKGWWDPNTETYSFGQYETVIKAFAEMFQNGWVTGLDDLAIDPIRAEFAEGTVGMFIAPAYDWAVYTNQFPAKCTFEFIDVPTFEEGEAPYKGVYLNRINNSICAVNYDAASDAKKKAIEEAWLFLNSDELNSTIYANGGIIPYKTEIIENTELLITTNADQWAQMSDIANYTGMFVYPDSILPLEEGEYGTTYADVFSAIVHGELEWSDEVVKDLEDRYNAAYQAAKEDPDIDTSNYAYEYAH